MTSEEHAAMSRRLREGLAEFEKNPPRGSESIVRLPDEDVIEDSDGFKAYKKRIGKISEKYEKRLRERLEDIAINPYASIPIEEGDFAKVGSWDFGDVAETFDDHVRRHLPGYDQIQNLAVSAALWNCYKGCRVLDIGCSTGLTLSMLSTRAAHPFEAFGIDSSFEMVVKARERFEKMPFDLSQHTIDFVHNTVMGFPVPDERVDVQGFDVIFALFTLQFIPTPKRWETLARIEELTREGGVFILAEKTTGDCPQGAELLSGLYSDWKVSAGVGPDEILGKWASLRGRLIPWPASTYEKWANAHRFRSQLIWCWGPFRAWAFWKNEERLFVTSC